MAQAANIFDAASLRGPRLAVAALPGVGLPARARLIPGAGNLLSVAATKKSQPVARFAARTLPALCTQFHPRSLGTAMMDVGLISLVFLAVGLSPGPVRHTPSLSPATLAFFLGAFLLFATQEGLYRNARKRIWTECGVVAKAILWAMLFSSLALRCSSAQIAWPALLFLSGVSVCVLCAFRRVSQSVSAAPAGCDHRNVLLVGSGAADQKITDAIQRDFQSRFSVKGFLPEYHLRGPDGSSRLRALAREHCVDEIIIATHDREIAEAAVREARRNQLDVTVAPDLYDPEAAGLELENLDGIPLLKIHRQPLPEWTLAVKRIADAILAAAGLVALSPLLLLVAAVVKLDSPGPVFYRGVRIGRKREKFFCCKFRTMIQHADTVKEDLRRRNERDGAFFKLANDPRVTRVGGLLRRYSLDELPQLWNVLRGEMSLVGPRPHPPDDVERYRVEDLQRLDFVPGITGLWQVTARGDQSFERSVTLDVEYIESWSLALDLRILWKTIPAVFQGRGA